MVVKYIEVLIRPLESKTLVPLKCRNHWDDFKVEFLILIELHERFHNRSAVTTPSPLLVDRHETDIECIRIRRANEDKPHHGIRRSVVQCRRMPGVTIRPCANNIRAGEGRMSKSICENALNRTILATVGKWAELNHWMYSEKLGQPHFNFSP